MGLVPHDRNTQNLDLSGQYLFNADEIYQFKDLKSIDLRGKRIIDDAEVEKLRKAYPGIKIRWDIKVGGNYYDSESTSVTLENFRAEDVKRLKMFEKLESVGIKGVRYDEEIEAELKKLENLSVAWELDICGAKAMSDARRVDLNGREIDCARLSGDLKQFKNVSEVSLYNCGVSADDLAKLVRAYPDVLFATQIEIGSVKIDTAMTEFTAPADLGSRRFGKNYLFFKLPFKGRNGEKPS